MKAIILLAISAFLWGLNFHLLNVMLKSVDFLEAGLWRYLFAVLFLGGFTLQSRLDLKAIRGKLFPVLFIGIVGLFCFNILLFMGLKSTTPINASLIISINPLITLLMSSFILKTPLRPIQIFGGMIGLGGVFYLLYNSSSYKQATLGFSIGELLILVATIIAAFYHILVKKYNSGISNIHFTFLINLVCCLCFLLLLPNMAFKPGTYPLDFWIAAISFGGLGTALTYIFWNKGVLLLGAEKAGIFMNIVPLSTALISVLVGQSIGFSHLIAGLMILGSVFIVGK